MYKMNSKQEIFDDFFTSFLWDILKCEPRGKKIAYLILKRRLNSDRIIFIEDDNSIHHDPSNMISDFDKIAKEKFFDNNQSSNKETIKHGKYLMRKIGSSVALDTSNDYTFGYVTLNITYNTGTTNYIQVDYYTVNGQLSLNYKYTLDDTSTGDIYLNCLLSDNNIQMTTDSNGNVIPASKVTIPIHINIISSTYTINVGNTNNGLYTISPTTSTTQPITPPNTSSETVQNSYYLTEYKNNNGNTTTPTATYGTYINIPGPLGQPVLPKEYGSVSDPKMTKSAIIT